MDFRQFLDYITAKPFYKLNPEDLTMGYMIDLSLFPLIFAMLLLSSVNILPRFLLIMFLLLLFVTKLLCLLYPRLYEYRVNRLTPAKERLNQIMG